MHHVLYVFECNVIYMKKVFKIEALKCSQLKGAYPAHDQPKYYHAPCWESWLLTLPLNLSFSLLRYLPPALSPPIRT